MDRPLTIDNICVGVDLVSIYRFQRLLNRFETQFKKYIFTRNELEQCGDSVQRLATRFAAKEATSKALQVGLAHMSSQGIPATDIEVDLQDNGVPILNLYGRAKALADLQHIKLLKVSLSHEQEYAIAMVTGMSVYQ